MCLCLSGVEQKRVLWSRLQINVKVVQYHSAHQNRSIKKERGLNVVNDMFVFSNTHEK